MNTPTVKPLREQLGQTVGLLLFGLLVLRQLSLFPSDGSQSDLIRWLLVTVFFVFACVAYATRHAAQVLARGPLDVLLPLCCAGFPLVLTEVPSGLARSLVTSLDGAGLPGRALFVPVSSAGVVLGLTLATLGELVTAIGLFSLRRSFSIFTEARELVTSGLYRWVRHPLYLGEIATVWGIAISWPTPWSAALTVVFTALQSWRARREEQLLGSTFPSYAGYRERTGFLWPRRRAG